MSDAFEWACRCGALRLSVAAGATSRLVCYCRDCRAFARHLGAADMLDAAGGTDLCQTLPHRITVTSGADHLACLRLTPRGPLRWYAGCCRTPMANTAPTRQLPFAALLVARAQPATAPGPILATVHRDHATGPVSGRAGTALGAIFGSLGRAVLARALQRHRTTPFFGPDGAPVAAPMRLGPDDRRAAYDEGAAA